MQRKKQRNKYVFADYVMSLLGWGMFFCYRNYFIASKVSEGIDNPFRDTKFYIELIFVPLYWLWVYFVSGYYDRLFHKSKMTEFFQTFFSVIVGAFFLFLFTMLNDAVASYKHYYLTIIVLVVIQFVCVYAARLYITYRYFQDLHSGKKGFRTLIVGDVAEGVVEAASLPKYMGHIFLGVVMRDSRIKGQIVNGFSCLGSYAELDEVIQKYNIEEVVLGLKRTDVGNIQKILNVLYRRNIHIKVIPEVYEKLIGSAKLAPLYGCNMMEISHDLMSPFQMRIKRMMDVVIASLVLVVMLPAFVYIAIRVMMDSKGAPIYRQERIGRNGKPFTMYKFRSMIKSAEKEKPMLTSPDDDRITKYGSFLRKYRIDELPQFWNVIKGDMALVGPRPERQFFIDSMVESEPDYFFLQKIRPGITSLGMVKYGYADTVDKMLKRFKYDLIYIENMSLLLDFKVLYYTFFVIFTGKGV